MEVVVVIVTCQMVSESSDDGADDASGDVDGGDSNT